MKRLIVLCEHVTICIRPRALYNTINWTCAIWPSVLCDLFSSVPSKVIPIRQVSRNTLFWGIVVVFFSSDSRRKFLIGQDISTVCIAYKAWMLVQDVGGTTYCAFDNSVQLGASRPNFLYSASSTYAVPQPSRSFYFGCVLDIENYVCIK